MNEPRRANIILKKRIESMIRLQLKKSRLQRMTASKLLLSLFLLSSTGSAIPDNVPTDRAEWFRAAKWGVFLHFLAGADVTPDEWIRRVDGFDVNGLVQQLTFAKTGYLIITVGQNSGYYLSPNRTYDNIVRARRSKCSRRDLISDLAEALSASGIRLLVYLPSGAPNLDKAAAGKLQWQNGPHENADFQISWAKIISEWSNRWGRKVSGWWFDGCYWPDVMYRRKDGNGFKSLAMAARSGNSSSLVAFNGGVANPIRSISKEEDYTAGEIKEPEAIETFNASVDGAQWHMLSFLGRSWAIGPPRFTDDEAADITVRVVKQGGVVTWDVPHGPTGLIDPSCLRQLHSIGTAVRGLRKN